MTDEAARAARTEASRAPLLVAADRLRALLAGARLPLELPHRDEAEAEAARSVAQLADYVIPRLADLDAPALVVVGGSTGAGKSTLVNSLVGASVSLSGVLRPTTRGPVLVHHPDAAHRFADDRVLPGLARITSPAPPAPSQGELALVAHEAVPATVALLDTPDIDSVVDANRALAGQLLAAADLWVFVTTAARYADAVPWELLGEARRRAVALVLVLNRTPPDAGAEVAAHLTSLLTERGLGDTEVFVVDEQPLVQGRLPAAAIAPLAAWLDRVAQDQELRTALVRKTLRGAVRDLAARAETVAAALDADEGAAAALAGCVAEAYEQAAAHVAQDIREGAVVRGEVLTRWHELVGGGDLGRLLQSGLGRLRDKLGAVLRGRPTSSEELAGAVESAAEAVLRWRADEAAAAVAERWRQHPAGAALLADAPPELARASAGLGDAAARLVRDWQSALVERLRRDASSKRGAARALSYGVNGVALVVMMGVFASTGGLTGIEAAIAGGSSAVGHKLLEALLGDQAIRSLAEDARRDLDQRVRDLLALEAERFLRRLPERDPGAGAALRQAARRLSAALDGRSETRP